ncbi:MAG: hypothetical protein ACI83W_002700 [Marinoscillum sp.]
MKGSTEAAIGALWVIDLKPIKLNNHQIEALEVISNVVIELSELNKKTVEFSEYSQKPHSKILFLRFRWRCGS